jgi:AcrR family transcriptional regulator
VTQPPARRRRPRNRRQQILDAAAEQFRASGYDNVAITDIADAVGITGAALYRHFSGKQDLLVATLDDAADRFKSVAEKNYNSLDDLFAAISGLSLERREVGVVWARETGRLPDDIRDGLRARLFDAIEPVRTAIATARPDLSADVVDLLLWAVIAITAAPGYNAIKIEPGRFRRRFVDVAGAVCSVTAIESNGQLRDIQQASATEFGLLPASRREAILTAASRLFSIRGYQAVGVDDIGAAAGITGATVYYHFPSKSAILDAALTRCLESLFFDLSGALNAASTSGEALDLVLRSSVRTTIEQGGVVGALFDEISSLPADDRARLRQYQLDYLAEWVALLVAHRPTLTVPEAQVLVNATISMITSMIRIRHLALRPTIQHDLVTLGRAVFGLDVGYPPSA